MASRGTLTTSEVDLCKTYEVPQLQVVEGPAPGQSQKQIQAGQGMIQEQPWIEEFCSVGDQVAQHEPGMCTSSPEIQPCPVL